MSLPSPVMMNSWVDDTAEEIHPSIPLPGDKYDNLGRNMSLPSPVMMNSWADDTEEEIHPSVPLPGDKYDNLGRNMSAQVRREKKYGRWKTVVYSKKFY